MPSALFTIKCGTLKGDREMYQVTPPGISMSLACLLRRSVQDKNIRAMYTLSLRGKVGAQRCCAPTPGVDKDLILEPEALIS